jgi:two-component sensor histidine kinase
MAKRIFICILAWLVMCVKVLSQPPEKARNARFAYHPASEDKQSWQRLNLLLSATYYRVVNEGAVDFNNCLLYASRSLGLSRLPLLSEGIDHIELLADSKWVDRRDPSQGIGILSQLSGKKHLQQLILLGAYYTFLPRNEYKTDSAESLLFKSINEARLLKEAQLEKQARCLLGKMYFETNRFRQGDSVFARLIQDCEVTGDKETTARTLVYRALFPDYSPATSQDRIIWFQKAAELYHQLGDIEGEINAITDAGYLLIVSFQLQTAHDQFSKALQLEEVMSYPYIHYNTDALAMVTAYEGKFGEPLRFALQTIKSAEITKDSIGWAYFFTRLGLLYDMEGQRDEESLKWYSKSLHRFLQAGDARVSILLNNIVYIMRRQDSATQALDLLSSITKKIPAKNPEDRIYNSISFAVCFSAIKQYQKAEHYMKEAQRILNESNIIRYGQLRAIMNMKFGEIYFEAGQFDSSKKYLEAYLADPLRENYFSHAIVAISRLAVIDSTAGDLRAALHLSWKHRNLLDSNFRISRIRQAEELGVMYQTEEKENQIVSLSQQARLEEANFREATLLKNFTIGGIVAVLIIAGLLYRQNRIKQKSNILITHKNQELQHFLTEKEWLLKEIHHRVKNNLQIVMSLLNSQSAYIDNEPALTAIHDSQHRVQAMSLIHQKLYGSENVSSIDMSIYIRELATYLSDSFDSGQRIRFIYDIEPLEMDVSQAVPLGLILNEAITNALKYAYPDGKSGVISIMLSTVASQRYLLQISDNGIGISTNSLSKKGSLGMSLMEGLSADLDGQFTLESDHGTSIKITFVQDRIVKRLEKFSEPALFNN